MGQRLGALALAATLAVGAVVPASPPAWAEEEASTLSRFASASDKRAAMNERKAELLRKTREQAERVGVTAGAATAGAAAAFAGASETVTSKAAEAVEAPAFTMPSFDFGLDLTVSAGRQGSQPGQSGQSGIGKTASWVLSSCRRAAAPLHLCPPARPGSKVLS